MKFSNVINNLKRAVKEGVMIQKEAKEVKAVKGGFVEKEIKKGVCKHMDTAPKAEEIKDSVQYDNEAEETKHNKVLKALLALRIGNAIAAFVWSYILVNTSSLIIGAVAFVLLISVICSLFKFTKLSRKLSNRFNTSL